MPELTTAAAGKTETAAAKVPDVETISDIPNFEKKFHPYRSGVVVVGVPLVVGK